MLKKSSWFADFLLRAVTCLVSLVKFQKFQKWPREFNPGFPAKPWDYLYKKRQNFAKKLIIRLKTAPTLVTLVKKGQLNSRYHGGPIRYFGKHNLVIVCCQLKQINIKRDSIKTRNVRESWQPSIRNPIHCESLVKVIDEK